MRPEETDRQRAKETTGLRRFVGTSLLASLFLHVLVLSLQADRRWSLKPKTPTEVTIVPPEPRVSPSPQVLPSPEPINQPEPLPSAPPELSAPTESEQPIPPLPQATTTPEGRPEVAVNESPLVGSGLAEGTGGFSEGISLNRSDSPIRGSGGGARRGVPGGDPGIAPTPVNPPPATAPSPAPSPLAPPETNSRWAVCRRCPSPDYPRTALQSGREGRVLVTVDLDRRGRVTGVRLADSSGDAELDRAVLNTVRKQWRFEAIPGGAENLPVEVYMTVNGSELNQQAQVWGNQTAVEVPATGFTSAPPAAISASEPPSEPSSEPSQPAASAAPAASPTQADSVSETTLEAELLEAPSSEATPAVPLDRTPATLTDAPSVESTENVVEKGLENPSEITSVTEPLLEVEPGLEMPMEIPEFVELSPQPVLTTPAATPVESLIENSSVP
ncbi:MAG: TonB family protein [Leptolyngbya sp. IPPAS B-1204]|nr:energy transducer TonB [Elainella sp. C42_A2020_010]RNJ65505.1 MAG: energy transducer TonB [Leptolyngbya sp. IPPAS B-1204]